jgi:cell wall-associated protease
LLFNNPKAKSRKGNAEEKIIKNFIMKIKILLCAVVLAFQTVAFAQMADQAPDNWHHLDYGKDGFQGISTAKMYDALADKKPMQVIVAVIDSGVDVGHEDLKEVMWVNTNEIPGNGIDDDKNGYVDDIHGWNFIGGKDGNVGADQLEITRLYVKYKKKYENVDVSSLSKKEKKDYKKYEHYKKVVEEKLTGAQQDLTLYSTVMSAIDAVGKKLGKENFTLADLEKFESTDPELSRGADVLMSILSQGRTIEELRGQLESNIKHFSAQAEFQYNTNSDPRAIVGDNYADSYEKGYGNNDYQGPDASHGTHVSGIIAASRGNGVGMDGVSNAARIMTIRAVPDGDERDKDVANAIIYAVDNGASVVNMSFGKSYSWDKEAVDKAIKYASKHDVLLVHAAGNSHQNNDNSNNFPNDKYEKAGWFKPKNAKNWLEIGALSWQGGEDAPATFSNYGKAQIDVFSPGVAIYSTIPDNKYAHFNGTSMAAPVAAGIAAAIRSYFPDLSAIQVKEILMQSAVSQTQKVKTPGSGELVSMKELSITGGTVNAYRAIELAKKTEGKAKKKNRKFKMTVPANGSSSEVVSP